MHSDPATPSGSRRETAGKPATVPQTRAIWQEQEDADPRRTLFLTTCTNDDPWGLVERIEFEHIGRTAQISVFSLTEEFQQ